MVDVRQVLGVAEPHVLEGDGRRRGAGEGKAAGGAAGSAGSRSASWMRASAALPAWYCVTAPTTCEIGAIR
nr:hypothetical protein [Actinospica acidiphila]